MSATAKLLRPRSLSTLGINFKQGVVMPVTIPIAKQLESDKRFEVKFGEDYNAADDDEDAPDGRPSKKQDRVAAIVTAIGKLDEHDYTNDGKPDARALTRELGWQVTAAERDLAYEESQKEVGEDGAQRRSAPASTDNTQSTPTPLEKHGGEEKQEPDAPSTGNNTTLQGKVQSTGEESNDALTDAKEKGDLGNNAPQNKLANDTGAADNGNLGLDPNMQKPDTNDDGTDKAIANADGSAKGPSKLDPKEKGDMSPNAFGASGDNPKAHVGARQTDKVDTANGPDDQMGVVNASGAPLHAAEQAHTTDPELEPSRKVGLKLTKHRNPKTGELTDQAEQSRGPKEGVDDEEDPTKAGAKEI